MIYSKQDRATVEKMVKLIGSCVGQGRAITVTLASAEEGCKAIGHCVAFGPPNELVECFGVARATILATVDSGMGTMDPEDRDDLRLMFEEAQARPLNTSFAAWEAGA